MRLIDLDEILEEDDEFISVYYLNHLPTIEAIPYSLLKELQDKYGNACTYGHILKCIDDWRKENETTTI